MRPWTRLRVPLEAEGRTVGPLDALQRFIEQRAMCGLERIGQTTLIHGEPVVLARDRDFARCQVDDRMIGAMVTEFHLDSTRAARQRQQLVTEADAENRQTGLQDRGDRFDGIGAGFRIARPIREEDTVRLHGEHVLGRRRCRDDRDPAVMLGQKPQDVSLDAEIVRNHVVTGQPFAGKGIRCRPVRAGIPLIGRLGRHDLGKVHPGEAGETVSILDRLGLVDISGHDAAGLRTFFAEDPGQFARIDLGD